MGDLIVMTRPTASRRPLPNGAEAAILFFTGVRYSRLSDEVAPETTTPRRRRSEKVKNAAEPQNA